MKKKEIITIAGKPGSGKSSTANGLASKLSYQRFSSGDFMRKIAIDMGIDLNQLSKVAETNPSIDHAIDHEVQKASEMKQVVIDSRLAFHWIPDSFKVYLELSPEVAKNRIMKSLETDNLRKQSESHDDPETTYTKITERLASEKKRYLELYGIDHTNHDNFDLVIDTSAKNLDEVIDEVFAKYQDWLNQ